MNEQSDDSVAQTSIVLKFKPKENSDVLVARPAAECRHYSFEVDEEAGTVECEQCKKSLDPIFVLMRLTAIYKEQDYKYDKIIEFEQQERARAEKRRQKWAARKG